MYLCWGTKKNWELLFDSGNEKVKNNLCCVVVVVGGTYLLWKKEKY